MLSICAENKAVAPRASTKRTWPALGSLTPRRNASRLRGASHGAVRVLYRDVLGIASLDTVNRTVQLRFTDLNLDRCEGSLPTPDGKVQLHWRKDGAKLRYRVGVPSGYSVKVDNRSQLELVEEP